MRIKTTALFIAAVLTIAATGCSGPNKLNATNTINNNTTVSSENSTSAVTPEASADNNSADKAGSSHATELEVRFGDDRKPFYFCGNFRYRV